mmetsp:Transcript_38002/g.89584  ORF Transcript_38002/g.89584 Transcript_38002/m.89584 type:complete len:306 (+) Transcript_38002:1232-2149(+)
MSLGDVSRAIVRARKSPSPATDSEGRLWPLLCSSRRGERPTQRGMSRMKASMSITPGFLGFRILSLQIFCPGVRFSPPPVTGRLPFFVIGSSVRKSAGSKSTRESVSWSTKSSARSEPETPFWVSAKACTASASPSSSSTSIFSLSFFSSIHGCPAAAEIPARVPCSSAATSSALAFCRRSSASSSNRCRSCFVTTAKRARNASYSINLPSSLRSACATRQSTAEAGSWLRYMTCASLSASMEPELPRSLLLQSVSTLFRVRSNGLIAVSSISRSMLQALKLDSSPGSTIRLPSSRRTGSACSTS